MSNIRLKDNCTIDGLVGIGTNSPAGTLDILTGSTVSDMQIVFKEDSSNIQSMVFREGDVDYFSIQHDGSDTTPNNLLKIRSADGSDGTLDVDIMTFKQNGNVGIGTTTIPHGGVGYAMLALEGANADAAGPHVQITTASDDYPLFQQLNYHHDNISLNFDSYYDGGWKSSDLGSNFQIYKISNLMKIRYDSGVTAGSVITWNTGIVLDTSGKVGIGTTPTYKFVVSGETELAGHLRDSDGSQGLNGQGVSRDGGGILWADILIPFTGKHRAQPIDDTMANYSSSIDDLVGKIVVAKNGFHSKPDVSGSAAIRIDDAWTDIAIANKYKDKTVYGVISSIDKQRKIDDSKIDMTEYASGSDYHPCVITGSDGLAVYDEWMEINSIGEGAVWVIDVSGSFENGDYITTSAVNGYGTKQDDDVHHNYTLGKITMDCDFDLNASASYNCVEFEWSGSTYRRSFVGCTYHCG